MKIFIVIFPLLYVANIFATPSWTGEKKVTSIDAVECSTLSQSLTCFTLDGMSQNFCFYETSPMAKAFHSYILTSMSTGMNVNISYESWAMPNCSVGSTYKTWEVKLVPN